MAEREADVRGREERSADDIRRDIDSRRRSMDATIDALQRRLRPGHLLHDVKTKWEEGHADPAGFAIGLARRHPIPLAIIGAGVAALLLENATHSLLDLEERERDRLDDPLRRTLPTPAAPPPTLAAARARSAATVGEGEPGQGESPLEGFEQAVRDNPWAVGAAALGLGLAMGLAIPRTRYEDDLMGERSDAVADEARRAGREALAKGRVVARAAASAAEARAHAVDPRSEPIGEAVHEVVQEAERAARAKARQVDLTEERLEEIARRARGEEPG